MGTPPSFGRRVERRKAQRPTSAGSKETATRRESRKRTILTGMLSAGRGAFTVNCIIIDLSKSGARVRVESGAEIGGDMILVNLREKIAFETRVVWRRDRDVGLEFKRAHDLNQATTSEMKILRRYCTNFRPALICAGDGRGRFRE